MDAARPWFKLPKAWCSRALTHGPPRDTMGPSGQSGTEVGFMAPGPTKSNEQQAPPTYGPPQALPDDQRDLGGASCLYGDPNG